MRFYILFSVHDGLKSSPAIMLKLIEQSDSNLAVLITGLFQEVTAGNHAGKNGFYWLMGALNHAAKNSTDHADKIIGVISKLIEKSDSAALMAGLFQKATTGNHVGKNGFYWLLISTEVQEMSAEQKKILFSLILSVVIKLNDQLPSPLAKEVKDSILKLKNQLGEPLRKYLETINDSQTLQKISAKDTLLGALIDGNDGPTTHGFFEKKAKETEMRVFVDRRIAELQASSLAPTSSGAIK